MIKEHEDLIDYINLFINNIGLMDNFTVKYIEDEFQAIEINLFGRTLDDKESTYFEKHLQNTYNHIIKEIYTIEKGYLYVVYLNPIQHIRFNKINKLQSRIYETNNKV